LMLGRARSSGVVHVAAEGGGFRWLMVEGDLRASLSSDLDGSDRGIGCLCAGVVAAFRWPLREVRFEVGLAGVGRLMLGEPERTADLVLRAMREVTPAEQVRPILEGHVDTPQQLTAWGRALLAEATLTASERLLLELVQRQAAGSQLLRAGAGCEPALHTWAALCAFGAVARARVSGPDYALLLRKRSQLRRQASPEELLDLMAGERPSPAAARRALHRLALKVHPDTLGPDIPEAVHRLSTELMQALLQAEAALRAAPLSDMA